MEGEEEHGQLFAGYVEAETWHCPLHSACHLVRSHRETNPKVGANLLTLSLLRLPCRNLLMAL
jgi:hypothetical protein